jgi:hypothetical protein
LGKLFMRLWETVANATTLTENMVIFGDCKGSTEVLGRDRIFVAYNAVDDNSDDNPADIERYATVSKLPVWSHGFPVNQHFTAQHNTKRKMIITDF